ncbi:MAG: hypothetical protein HRT89_09125 [Lentisphaeria bacterium]|nr:hypothetical protein [Lentisphaeria bacterium]
MKILIYQNRYFYMADRYAYFPMIGFCFLFIFGLYAICFETTRRPTLNNQRNSFAFYLLLGFMFAKALFTSVMYVYAFRNTGSFASYAKAEDPKNYIAWNFLGVYNLSTGKIPEAEKAFKGAIGAHVGYANAYYNLAVIYKDRAEVEKAQLMLKRALLVNPGHHLSLELQKNLEPKKE